jgi:hypothetical protein
MDDVVEDLKKLGMQRYWMVSRDVQSWKRVLLEVEARCVLNCY